MDLVDARVPGLLSRVSRLVDEVTDSRRVGLLPHVVENGRWSWEKAGRGGAWTPHGWRHGSWTGGFAAGTFLAAALLTVDDEERRRRLRAAVDVVVARLETRARDTSTHDIGFLFWPSAALSVEMSGHPWHRAVALEAARTLMTRSQRSGMLLSWGEAADPRAAGLTAIDTMMNLPLLWWSARHGLPDAAEVARAHCDGTARHYFREDGTVWHYLRVGEDGRVRERGSKQGRDVDSAWSRGLSWAVHGFVTAYLCTEEPRYLEVAQRAAAAFMRLLGDRPVPPYDFAADEGGGPVPSDASAAAVVASALQQAQAHGVDITGSAGKDTDAIVTNLLQHALTAEAQDGLLTLTSYSVPEGMAVDGGATWADFFLLRAVAPYWAASAGVDVAPLFRV